MHPHTQDLADKDFEPGLSDYSDDDDSGDEDGQPARKRAKTSSTASKGKQKEQAPAVPAPAASSAQQQAVSGGGLGSLFAMQHMADESHSDDEDATGDEDEDEEHPGESKLCKKRSASHSDILFSVTGHPLFHARSFAEHALEREEEGMSRAEAADEWEAKLEALRDEIIEDDGDGDVDDPESYNGCPCGVCHYGIDDDDEDPEDFYGEDYYGEDPFDFGHNPYDY